MSAARRTRATAPARVAPSFGPVVVRQPTAVAEIVRRDVMARFGWTAAEADLAVRIAVRSGRQTRRAPVEE